ncbi:MAG: hypothetical protein NT085_02960 [candidate division SR1 bacterium]|nr:hypothetical protein [candidate division SR1 bacterium]
MYTKEQKILRFSMMLLFLALMIVYIVWYQVKGNELKIGTQPKNSGSGIQILSKSGDLMPTISTIVDTQDDVGFTTTTGNVSITKTGTTTINKTGVTVSVPITTTGTMNKNTTIKLLSGTSIYYGSIAVIEKLGIKYQYALADDQGIRYIYLGTPSYDFTSIARALKGSLYTVATEQDLLQNKLFGNKVVFINLPEYKDKQVLMLVYMNDGIRLIQMEYSLYHKSKAYLKSLFTD